MKLIINGDISSFYVQTLCLLFYPGSKFSESSDDDGITVTAEVTEDDSFYCAEVTISDGDDFSGSAEISKDEKLSRPSMIKKIVLGKAFLEAGNKAVGIVPPWGILTGVRPSKLAMWQLEAGVTRDGVVKSLCKEYSVNEGKADLACRVALAEQAIMKPEHSKKCSVYIAIPFCPTRCSYCSFVSYTSGKLLSLIPEYLVTLKSEIERTARLIERCGLGISSVYIGGGTPTVLDSTELEGLLTTVSSCFDVYALDEFTLEAGRPDTIDLEKMRIASKYGVTRASVNTQTLNDEILSSLGRRHTSDDFFRAYECAKSAGIKTVNVDLIAGLPGESFESFASSVDRIAALRPENVTVHTFCVKKSAELKSSGVYSAKCETAEKSVAYSQDILISNAYLPYYMYRQKNAVGNLENVGYTLPHHEGVYNVLMMEEVQSIFAVGASAVSKLVRIDGEGRPVIKRYAENKYPFEYLREKSGDEYEEAYKRYSDEVLNFFNS